MMDYLIIVTIGGRVLFAVLLSTIVQACLSHDLSCLSFVIFFLSFFVVIFCPFVRQMRKYKL